MKLTQKKNKGFTLIEILLVVGFIALASIGVYAVYTKVQTANAANAEGRNIDLIRSGIKTLYGSQTAYTGLTNTVVNQARITPETMRTAVAGDILNSFGGAVAVTVTGLGGTNNAFKITTNGVPGAVCAKLVAALAPQFDQVTIGATAGNIKAFPTSTINVANIATSCNLDTVPAIQFDSL